MGDGQEHGQEHSYGAYWEEILLPNNELEYVFSNVPEIT